MSVSGDKQLNQNRTKADTEPIQTEQDTQKTTQKILELITLNPCITRNEMEIECGVTPDAIKLQLKEKGLILRIGSDGSGSWEVMDHSS